MNTWPAQAEEAVRKQAEERRRAAEAEAEAERAKAAESRARADAELEEQRQREMQALQTDAMDLAGPQACHFVLKHRCCEFWLQVASAVNMLR
jgi:putative heme iron utilization protein